MGGTLVGALTGSGSGSRSGEGDPPKLCSVPEWASRSTDSSLAGTSSAEQSESLEAVGAPEWAKRLVTGEQLDPESNDQNLAVLKAGWRYSVITSSRNAFIQWISRSSLKSIFRLTKSPTLPQPCKPWRVLPARSPVIQRQRCTNKAKPQPPREVKCSECDENQPQKIEVPKPASVRSVRSSRIRLSSEVEILRHGANGITPGGTRWNSRGAMGKWKTLSYLQLNLVMELSTWLERESVKKDKKWSVDEGSGLGTWWENPMRAFFYFIL